MVLAVYDEVRLSGTRYERAISMVGKAIEGKISVPELAELLDVETTTLNARFRRSCSRGIITLRGRTNYIPGDIALGLVERHKYALLGWPTLYEISMLKEMKPGTVKAQIKRLGIENHLDLTKRLRISPRDVDRIELQKDYSREMKPEVVTKKLSEGATVTKTKGQYSLFEEPFLPMERVSFVGRNDWAESICPNPAKFEPIRILDENYYLSRGVEIPKPQIPQETINGNNGNNHKQAKPEIYYDPKFPPTLSECQPGMRIFYDGKRGVIKGPAKDVSSPAIKVFFRHEKEPFRKVILVVRKD